MLSVCARYTQTLSAVGTNVGSVIGVGMVAVRKGALYTRDIALQRHSSASVGSPPFGAPALYDSLSESPPVLHFERFGGGRPTFPERAEAPRHDNAAPQVTLKELWNSNKQANIQDPRATPGRKRVQSVDKVNGRFR